MPGFFVVDQRRGVYWLAGAGMTVLAGARKGRQLTSVASTVDCGH
ncbi:hypothetical protein FHY25_000029 [Xanthomonas arboricola]|nr:hypothetical protein [Xanthomonas campestris]MCW2005448.1 hypothetical protein [Xanthomonas campestris]